MVAREMREQLQLSRDLWQKGLGAVQEIEARLEARRQPMQATMASLSQTLEGAGNHLKKELRRRVDHLLDWHAGPVAAALQGFIGKLQPQWEELTASGTPASFRPALYRLFQEFAKGLAQLLTSEVNIILVEFIRAQEEWLRSELSRLWTPLFLALQEALTPITGRLQSWGCQPPPPPWRWPPSHGLKVWRCPCCSWNRRPAGALPGRSGCAPALVSWAGPGRP